MTDKKAKNLGVKSATKMVAFGALWDREQRCSVRIRRLRSGIHVTFLAAGGKMKVTSFIPKDKIIIHYGHRNRATTQRPIAQRPGAGRPQAV